jgi:hypothetical protein
MSFLDEYDALDPSQPQEQKSMPMPGVAFATPALPSQSRTSNPCFLHPLNFLSEIGENTPLRTESNKCKTRSLPVDPLQHGGG